jgi:hypothetical protein
LALEDREDTIEKKLDRALADVEAQIVVLIGDLDTKRGRILSTRINLDRALKMRKGIVEAMGPYRQASKEVTDFSFAAKEVQVRLKAAKLPSSLTAVDKTLVKAYSDDAFIELRSLGSQYAANINGKIYSATISGRPVKDVVGEVRQLLTGGQDRAGRPLASHAKTITVTRFREVDSSLMEQKAVNELGIKKFKYVGSLIKDSRQFCQDRVGKVFTIEEIRKWQDLEWQGKKQGSSFVTRGGWNCRHHLSPVVD